MFRFSELVLELPELLDEELDLEVDPVLELWDELEALDDLELLSDELNKGRVEKIVIRDYLFFQPTHYIL